MTVPAQKKIVKELEDLKPSKRKGYLKNFFADRKKLEDDRSKILERIEKQLKDKKGVENAFNLIPDVLKISEDLADDEGGLKMAQLGQKILNKMEENPELKSVVEKHRAKYTKDSEELNVKAQDAVFKEEFFEAGAIYRKSARLILIANDEERSNKFLQLADECDSQGTI